MLHSPIFVILEALSSPCHHPAFPWKTQGRSSPFHTLSNGILSWISNAVNHCCFGIAHISIYFYILTKFANKKNCQMRIRIIICLAEAQTHCSREGLSKCPPAFSISISGGAEILPPLLNLPLFFSYLWAFFAWFPFSYRVSLSLSLPGGCFPDWFVGWVVQGEVPVGKSSLEGLWICPVKFWPC